MTYDPQTGQLSSTIKDVYALQLDRIEAKLDQLLAKKKPKARASKDQYSPHFELAWAEYPRRVGNNSKRKASDAYEKRRLEGVMADELNFATMAYCRFCDATTDDKQYVMMASTFYGCQRPYENDWTIPTAPDNVPRDNSELVSWAKDKGYRGAYPNESYPDYRKALEVLHRKGE